MKILVFGDSGQLGFELMRQGRARKLEIHGVDYPDTDITVMNHVREVFADFRPRLAINAAAYTDVDLAESESERAMSINRDGPANIALLCKQINIPLIHVSTDYVFDGAKGSPYRETDPVSPVGVYGRSKAEGESALRDVLTEHIILRTAWLYGYHGRNFVKTILKLAGIKEEIRVVSDQFGCPTSAADLADAILTIAGILDHTGKKNWGTYHYCGRGIISWHELAEAIVNVSRRLIPVKTRQVLPITTADYPTKAQRPPYSALNCDRIKKHYGISSRPWLNSLKNTIREIVETPEDQMTD